VGCGYQGSGLVYLRLMEELLQQIKSINRKLLACKRNYQQQEEPENFG